MRIAFGNLAIAEMLAGLKFAVGLPILPNEPPASQHGVAPAIPARARRQSRPPRPTSSPPPSPRNGGRSIPRTRSTWTSPERAASSSRWRRSFSPNHVANVKALSREGYFVNGAVTRVQDNFVSQWAQAAEPARPPEGRRREAQRRIHPARAAPSPTSTSCPIRTPMRPKSASSTACPPRAIQGPGLAYALLRHGRRRPRQ